MDSLTKFCDDPACKRCQVFIEYAKALSVLKEIRDRKLKYMPDDLEEPLAPCPVTEEP